MFPAGEIGGFVGLMETIINGNFVCAGGAEESEDMGYCVCGGEGFGEEGVQFSGGVDEIVVGVY